MPRKRRLTTAQAKLAEHNREKAEYLAERIRSDDVTARREARQHLREGPSAEVERILKEALQEAMPRPAAASPPSKEVAAQIGRRSSGRRPARTGGTPPKERSFVFLPDGKHHIRGSLQRLGPEWALRAVTGVWHRVTFLEEPWPTRKVGRTMNWVLKVKDGHVNAVTEKHHDQRKSVFAVPGGAVEGGSSRRH